MKKLFGTDGVRGLANSDLTCELAMQIGKATASALMLENKKCKHIIIGKDTRLSSSMLETAVASGICSMGTDVTLLGVVPTPTVAYLVKKHNADAGIMISASHNPWMYNGIKIFGSDGMKVSDSIELLIEKLIHSGDVSGGMNPGTHVGECRRSQTGKDDYCRYISSTCDIALDGLKVLFDCANGSSGATASNIFHASGSDCTIVNDFPDGVNINNQCGSTFIENLCRQVTDGGYDVGFAFDGDADRVLAVDHLGNIVDGDKILAILSKHFMEKDMLVGNKVAGTVMSNLGFVKFCSENGIEMVQTGVGDRYVMEAMENENLVLGGEQSGHTIIRNYQTTGDGQLTAIQILKIMKETGKSLEQLSKVMRTYPQILKNITVDNGQKSWILDDDAVIKVIQMWENKLKDNGRILVRSSGTEPLIRVMVEGSDDSIINSCADEISHVIKGRLSI